NRVKDMVAVVTGATSGIGREVARLLAEQGMRVLGIGRSPDRCRQAGQELRNAEGRSSVELLPADLSSREEIQRLAAEIKARTARVDILVNNAGVFTFTRKETVDGLETQLAVNWLSAFLLTGLLAEPLRRAGGARVVNLSSGSHFAGRMYWEDLGLSKRYRGLQAYCQSKLAMVLFTAELDRRFHGQQMPAAYAVDPGLVKTDIAAKGTNALVRLAWKIRTRNGIPARQAAESVAWCASSPDARGMGGLYWKDRSPRVPSKEALDPASARRLWETGECLSGVRYAGAAASVHAAHA
ncbi:MAG TPA: SDR family NAD(P)-dependent oxidoreductase, partial [Spirochaetia bacterium]|nr:SDR family NAD(P)-dependent oxidoreductase [Spirochaetia bacterium]